MSDRQTELQRELESRGFIIQSIARTPVSLAVNVNNEPRQVELPPGTVTYGYRSNTRTAGDKADTEASASWPERIWKRFVDNIYAPDLSLVTFSHDPVNDQVFVTMDTSIENSASLVTLGPYTVDEFLADIDHHCGLTRSTALDGKRTTQNADVSPAG